MVHDGGSKRAWVFVAAAGLAAIFLGAASAPAGNPSLHRAEIQEQSDAKGGHSQDGGAQRASVHDQHYGAESTNPTDNIASKHDERGDPSWPEIATAVATGILALIAAGQAGLFVWQLKLMRKGVEDATTAANAARKSAEIAEKTLTELERPHLFIENIKLDHDFLREWSQLDDEELKKISVTARWDIVNYGRSPAIIRQTSSGIYIGKELPSLPLPNPNDIWKQEIPIPQSGARRGFGVFWRYPLTTEIVGELYLGRTFIEGHIPTKLFFFTGVRYESVQGLTDEVGVVWEYLVDIRQWIPCEMENYTYRRLQ
jgi:hypothetical protein